MYGEALGKHAVTEYRTAQEREANNLLKGLLDDPDDFDRLVAKYMDCFSLSHKTESLTTTSDVLAASSQTLGTVIVLIHTRTNSSGSESVSLHV